MKTLKTAFAAALLLMAGSLAHGHGNHEEEAPVTRQVAGGRAMGVVSFLVGDQKLAESWKAKQPKDVVAKATPAGVRWIATFHNPDEKDPARQTLYVFLDDMGNYIGANHTGKY